MSGTDQASPSYRERTQYEDIIKDQIMRVSRLFSNLAGVDTKEKDCYTQFRNIKEAILTLENLLHPYFDSNYKENIKEYKILRSGLSASEIELNPGLFQSQFHRSV